jgi:hypothetical protein
MTVLWQILSIGLLDRARVADCSKFVRDPQPSVLYFIHRLTIEAEGDPNDLIGRTGVVFGITGT